MKYVGVFTITVLSVLGLILETTRAHEWKAPKKAAELRNPLAANELTIATGRALYRQHCNYCHGDDMRGMTVESTGLSKATPDLMKNLKMHSEGGFFWKIREGRGDMPAFREVLTDREIWSIITAIKQATKEK